MNKVECAKLGMQLILALTAVIAIIYYVCEEKWKSEKLATHHECTKSASEKPYDPRDLHSGIPPLPPM